MKIAVSACLLGTPCRYDGEARPCGAVCALADWADVVPVCPEVLGGLRVPHPPSEIVTANRVLQVVDAQGKDTTQAFLDGADKTLARVQKEGCTLAVMKSKSPSCGNGRIYDGTFSGTLVDGYGVATRALRAAGVRVIDETQLEACVVATQTHHPGQMPAILAETSAQCPALETDRLVLRPLNADDIDDVFAYCKDPDVGPDAGWAAHRSREDSRVFVQDIANAAHVFGIFEKVASPASAKEAMHDGCSTSQDKNKVACAGRFVDAQTAQTKLPATGPCIGSVGLIPDPARRNPDCKMLGYALAKWAWGQGYMTEAAQEVIRYGFEELALDAITCNHYTFNNRSGRVIEKCGFLFEGIIHGAEATPDGILQDIKSYYLPRETWDDLQKQSVY